MPLGIPFTGVQEAFPDRAAQGSGLAVPAGLEATYEYNGLILNNLGNIDKYRILDIDGLSDADVRDARDQNPGFHGETPFESFYGGRTITITGRIEAYSLNKLRDMQEALRTAFNTLTEKTLLIHTNDWHTTVEINCRKLAAVAMKESQPDQRFFRDFQIPLRASNPRLLSHQQFIAQSQFSFFDSFIADTSSSYLLDPSLTVPPPPPPTVHTDDFTTDTRSNYTSFGNNTDPPTWTGTTWQEAPFLDTLLMAAPASLGNFPDTTKVRARVRLSEVAAPFNSNVVTVGFCTPTPDKNNVFALVLSDKAAPPAQIWMSIGRDVTPLTVDLGASGIVANTYYIIELTRAGNNYSWALLDGTGTTTMASGSGAIPGPNVSTFGAGVALRPFIGFRTAGTNSCQPEADWFEIT